MLCVRCGVLVLGLLAFRIELFCLIVMLCDLMFYVAYLLCLVFGVCLVYCLMWVALGI